MVIDTEKQEVDKNVRVILPDRSHRVIRWNELIVRLKGLSFVKMIEKIGARVSQT